jgi:hypothetical protein
MSTTPRPSVSSVPARDRGPVADALLRVLGALPPSSATGDRAARRELLRLVEELRGMRKP